MRPVIPTTKERSKVPKALFVDITHCQPSGILPIILMLPHSVGYFADELNRIARMSSAISANNSSTE